MGHMGEAFIGYFGSAVDTGITEEIVVFSVIFVFFVVLFSIVGIILMHSISKRNSGVRERFLLLDNLTGCKTADMFVRDYHKKTANLLLLDLNNVREIKELYGSKHSDEIIVDIASRLLSLFGIGKCYRIGFEEFIIDTKVQVSSEELREKLEFLTNEFVLSTGRRVMLDVSVGYRTKSYQNIDKINSIKTVREVKRNKLGTNVVLGKNNNKEEQVRR